MNIVQVSAECAPFMRVGFLADSVQRICEGLAGRGHRVTLIMPGYHKALEEGLPGKAGKVCEHVIAFGSHEEKCDVFKLDWQDNITVYFIAREEYFDRSGVYGNGRRDYDDNDRRFIYFNRAVVETLCRLNSDADIVHCHDWSAALLPALLRFQEGIRSETLAGATVFTLHDIRFQGLFPSSSFALTGLPRDAFTPDGLEYYGQLSLLKAGLLFSDQITIFDEDYLKLIMRPTAGHGLEGVLLGRQDAICAVPEAQASTAQDFEALYGKALGVDV